MQNKMTHTVLRKSNLFKQLASLFGARKAKVLILSVLGSSIGPYVLTDTDVECFVVWAETPQGHDYWLKVSERLRVRYSRGVRGYNVFTY